MVRKSAALILAVGLMLPGLAFALGLGELTLKSHLNEPFAAEIVLLHTEGLDASQIKIRLANHADFSRAGVDRAYFLVGLKFEIQMDENGSGILSVRSLQPVREPYLDFLLEARWPTGRLLREYTVLLDPPLFSGEGSGVTASISTATATVESSGDDLTMMYAEPQRDEPQRDEPQRDEPTARRYTADLNPQPMEGSKYQVVRDETLWSIATRARPSGVSVHQTMLDIQRLNPEAFIGNNINRLKAGYVLRLPGHSDISSDDLQRAVADVANQNQRWADTEAGVEPSADLRISSVDEAGTSQSVTETGEMTAGGLENRDMMRRDNDELRGRLDSQAQQIQTLQRLLTLKNDQIASLQAALGDEVVVSEVDAELELSGTVEELIEVVEEEAVASIEAEEPEAVTLPEPAPPPAPEPGVLDLLLDNILYLGLAAVLLLAGLAYVLRDKLQSLRQRMPQGAVAQVGDDEFAGVELGDDNLIVDEFVEQSSEDLLGTERLEDYVIAHESQYASQMETGDALSEADIYIAYGRYPQAVDLLKSAIEQEPINVEYRVKLLEVCVEMVEREEFQKQYVDVVALDDAAALVKAKELLEAVDGGETWLEDLPPASLSAGQIATARALQSEDEAGEDAAEKSTLAAEFEEHVEATGVHKELELELELDQSAVGEDDDLNLDLDDDLDSDAAEEGSAKLELVLDDAALALDDSALELDDSAIELDDAAIELDDAAIELDDAAIELDDAALELDGAAIELDDAAIELDDAALELDDAALELDDAALELELDDAPERMADGTAELELLDESSEQLDSGEDAELELLDDNESEVELLTLVETKLPTALQEVGVDASASEQPQELQRDSDGGLPDLELDDFEDEAEIELQTAVAALTGDDEETLDLSVPEDESADSAPASLDLDALIADTDEKLPAEFGELEVEFGVEDDEIELEELDEPEQLGELQKLADDDLDLSQSLDQLGTDSDDLEAEEDDLLFAADGDEVSTKLDLARAYIDMGDAEGARHILAEVLSDGSDAQQAEAQGLLDRIE